MYASERFSFSSSLSRAVGLVALTCGALRGAGAQSQGKVSGNVTDSIHGRPLVGAVIIATPAANVRDSVFHTALSDSRGRFQLVDLRAGRYAISAEHPYTDSIGVSPLPVEIEVPPTGVATVALSIPSAATLRRVLCPAAVRDTTLGVVLGTVRRIDGTVVTGANVVLKWSDFEVDRRSAAATQREVSAAVVTDSSGVYRACGVPVARTLFMQAQYGALAQTGVLEARVDEAGVLVRDLTLANEHPAIARADTIAPAAEATLARRLYSLPGRIVSAKGDPIVSAQVRLFGVDVGTATNDAGEFRLSGLPGGTQGLEVLALGYVPRRMRVEIGGDMRPMVITLEKTTVVLDSIRVIASRVKKVPFAYAEFEHRRANGFGRFIGEEEIEKRHAFKVTDLARSFPNIEVISPRNSPGEEYLMSKRLASLDGLCRLQIFIDGVEQSGRSDVNAVPPAAIHGIELHGVATAPVKYHVGTCGALFIWTK